MLPSVASARDAEGEEGGVLAASPSALAEVISFLMEGNSLNTVDDTEPKVGT